MMYANNAPTFADELRAAGIVELELHPDGTIKRIVIGEKPDVPIEARPFGLPEALQHAKDAEAEALKAERERLWQEDQIAYAHTTGFDLTGPAAGVTRTNDG